MIQNIRKDLRNIKPNKRLGQNFLIDKAALNKIISAADLSENDVVLEIGPGTGMLTRELLKITKKVIAVEKDKKMAEVLKNNFKDCKNLEIINKDILKIDDLNIKEYKLVANIPYYITSPIIRKFLEYSNPPKLMVLTIQKEVAQRICSRPPDMSLLAISVQFYAKPKIISYISKNSFWPKPKVDSAILKIQDIKNKNPEIDVASFFNILRAGFKQPRKQLQNNISSELR
ncbi:MAG: 16S rRNA (adenine(1518)-N(6)/adenine(1519)-N(6))-dimethyltransferase RsmA, partial [Candidatus Nealsonbacteria bacterium]|nr:16S rRNA (adenine(1518)-N(6)/adenine(1519)-N(6))-dimethyltransferase RsmA [Candidatus Nealsonbacteria bacterium]